MGIFPQIKGFWTSLNPKRFQKYPRFDEWSRFQFSIQSPKKNFNRKKNWTQKLAPIWISRHQKKNPDILDPLETDSDFGWSFLPSQTKVGEIWSNLASVGSYPGRV